MKKIYFAGSIRGERFGIPCHIFYDRGKTQLSAMLTGDHYFKIHPYSSEEEIYPIIKSILEDE